MHNEMGKAFWTRLLIALITSTFCAAFMGMQENGRLGSMSNARGGKSTIRPFVRNTNNPWTCSRFENERATHSRLCGNKGPSHKTDPASVHAMEWTEGSQMNSDSSRRRQLLFSMLTASSTMLICPPAEAEDVPADKVADGISPEDIEIMKSPLDDRDYLNIVLDNGLRVLMCSDPSSNEAAAAMDVHVGACSDPADVPGLAHFTEHMLFLGTKDYPTEDSFEAFLAANGGSSNAFTDSENTVFYFSMEAEADSSFAKGLSRFGSFFSGPLFTASATDRELNAIDSENAKNLQSDVFRYFQLEKSRANPKHPYSKFFTGNKKTLLDDTKAKGIDLRQELINFYERYYSANQMTLAIVAPQSIPTLTKMVTAAFSTVPNRGVGKPEEAWAGVPPFSKDSIIPAFQHVVQVVPVQDLRQLTLSWPIVYESEDDRRLSLLVKQGDYASHLIGHEGPGSLISYLKRQGWANSLAAATNAEFSDFETFEITVDLTSLGLAAARDVAGAVFSYTTMLRNEPVPNYVFEEVLQLDELEWRFMTKGSPGNYVQSLSTAMQKYPPSLYVAGPRRIALAESKSSVVTSSEPRTSFDSSEQELLTKALMSDLISKLTVDTVIVTVVSKTFEKQANQQEKWYGTKYRAIPIPSPTLDRMKYPPLAKDLKIAYPAPNEFIPTEVGLRVKRPPPVTDKERKRTFESRMQPIAPPKTIRDDERDGRWTVHFKEDDRFGQPKAFVVFQLLTKEAYSSPTRATLAQLYQACATDRLEEYAYDARLAGLTFNVQVLPRGVRLTFGGYNDKMQQFAAYVSEKLAKNVMSILPTTDVEFDRYKDNIMRGLSAFDAKQPYAHASYYSYLTIQPRRSQYTNSELRDAIKTVGLSDLVSYVETLWSSGKGEALVQGNLDEEEANTLVNTIDNSLSFHTIAESELPPRSKALLLPSNAPTRLKISEPNPFNGNSAAHVVLQSIGPTEKDHVLIEILSAIVEEPFYGELRTNQQLGYIVSSGIRALEETRTLAFIAQSSVAPAERLTTEILRFLDSFLEKTLEPLSEGDVAVYVKGLIDRKTEPDKQLASEVTRNWAEISSGRFQFDRIQREAASLLEVTKSDLLQFWNTIYVSDTRRMLITEIIPRDGPASSTQPTLSTGYSSGQLDQDAQGTFLGIDDIEEFRNTRQESG